MSRSVSFGPPRFAIDAPIRRPAAGRTTAPRSNPTPPALKSSTVCCSTLTLAPSANFCVTDFAIVNTYAVSPSWNVPSASFISLVRSKSPDRSDTIASPKLGSRLPGSASAAALTDVPSNSRAFSNRSS